MTEKAPTSYATDPTLYLYTSLTAGSSHILTATSRLETILKANKIPFRAIDVATDEKARMLWGRRSKGRKLPGLVRYGGIIGDLDQIEEWNEFGELKAQVGTDPTAAAPMPTPADIKPSPPSQLNPPPLSMTAPPPTSSSPHIKIGNTPARPAPTGDKETSQISLALKQASEEAAAKAKENAQAKLAAKSPSSTLKSEQTIAESTPSTEAAADSKDKEDIGKVEEKGKGKETSTEEAEEAEEVEEAHQSLKAAKRRASVQVSEVKNLGAHMGDSAVESTEDIIPEEAKAATEHRREPAVSATSPGEIKELAESLEPETELKGREGKSTEEVKKDDATTTT